MELKVDIIDYLGKFDNAIFVKLLLSENSNFYEAVFYYKAELITLSVDEKLENKLGVEIEKWSGYVDLMYKIVEKLPPYDNLLLTVPKLNLDNYK